MGDSTSRPGVRLAGTTTRSQSEPMTVRRKIVIVVAVALLSVVACIGYSIVHTWWHIPEAYAAWDTGRLLVEYMRSHNNKWPSSWDDLLSVTNRGPSDRIPLYGVGRYPDYALHLRQKVKVDWKFDPSANHTGLPVTRIDGTKFPIVWQGAEPNEMVRGYLSTNAPQAPSR